MTAASRWTPGAVDLLGTDTDEEIGRLLGIGRVAVAQARKRRRIPAYQPERMTVRFTVLISERDSISIREAATAAKDPDASTWARRALRLALAQRHPPARVCPACGGLGELDGLGRTCATCAP